MQKKIGKFSIVYYLIALLLLIVVTPFIECFRFATLVESVLLTMVLLSATIAMEGRRYRALTAAALAIPAVTGKWINFWRPDFVPVEFIFGFGILFIGFIVWNLILYVLRSHRVTTEILCAGIAGYVTLGWLWAMVYILVDRLNPEAFSFSSGIHLMTRGFNSIYFSFSTILTMGYGDIVPVSPVARMLAIMEAIAGVFYMTVLIARLVALYSTENERELSVGEGSNLKIASEKVSRHAKRN